MFTFLEELFGEVATVFPDRYFHIGGDEVGLKCWAENPYVNEVLTSWNRTGDYEYLQSYFIERVLGIVSRLGNKAAIGKGSRWPYRSYTVNSP